MLIAYQAGLVPPREPAPQPKSESEPERVISGSVIGYRAWRIFDWRLYGTGVDRAWEPGVQEATCDAGAATPGMLPFRPPRSHPAPAIGCHCGLTALARFDQGDAHWEGVDVFGAIEAWSEQASIEAKRGDVADATGVHAKADEGVGFVLHGNGFRARFAKVVLLAVDDEYPRAKNAAIRALAAEHGADVCKRSHLEDAAKEHGQLVPDEMLEWAVDGDVPDFPVGGYVAGVVVPSPWLPAPFFTAVVAPAKRKPVKLTRPAGICQVLGSGPPSHGKFRKGDRVLDRRRVAWQCVKGGRPGSWERDGELDCEDES